jgi:serine/threonine protein kinase/WD40 repeat protein
MGSSDSSHDALLERLAEEFVERHRRGKRPTVADYAARFPNLAAEIHDLFPALVQIESLKPVAGDLSDLLLPASASTDGRMPERFGEYRILREVGQGGMGVVYEAEQESLGRHVALKVLPRQALLKPTYAERFRREAKAAAQLHHTNIVPVFGVGECDGTPYYVMQFIRGEGLDKVLGDLRRFQAACGVPAWSTSATDGRVAHSLLTGHFATPAAMPGQESATSPTRSAPTAVEAWHGSSTSSAGGPERHYFRGVARVGLQVADALAHAHRQGILHRDIKPSNLLLDQHGTVWITDFGLAKAEGADDLTDPGDVVGTVRFMAPERFDGRSLPQGDVYGLGATLYELLTLRPAYADTDQMRLIDTVLHEPPMPPRKVNAHIPRDLETVVLKCLAKDPAERYASADVLADDLRRFLADRPILARRCNRREQIWRWCRRNPALAALGGSVLGLLVVIAVGGVVLSLLLHEALGQAQLAQIRAGDAEREARLREADALVGQAHGTRLSQRPGQRFEALAALSKAVEVGRDLGQPPQWFDRLRNEAIAALALPDVHITHSWAGFPPGTWRADVSPDFELYARTTRQGACSVRRIADDAEMAVLPALGEPVNISFGPGSLLGIRGVISRRFQLWDLAQTEPVLRLDARDIIERPAFHPNGPWMILTRRGNFMDVYTTATGTCKYHLDPPQCNPVLGNAALHPTEPVFANWSYLSAVVLVRDLHTGAVLISLTLPWRGLGQCTWSPDGHTLAVSDADNSQVHLYDFDIPSPGLRLRRVLRGRSGGGLIVRFNPAGDRIITRGWGGVVDLFDPATGRLLFSTPPFPSLEHDNIRFDPSGDRLAAAVVGGQGEQIGTWSIADGREYRALVHDGPGRWSRDYLIPAVHPGGYLAAEGLKDGLALFELRTGSELAFVPIPMGVASAQFDGAGNLFTNGRAGFFRWPLRCDPAKHGQLILGPPERLPFHCGDQQLGASRDGRVLAQPMFDGYGVAAQTGGWVLHPSSAQPRRLEPGSKMCNAAVSPDGRWVAFAHHLECVNVYEAATGRRVWQSPHDQHDWSRFSSDGRWLVTENDGSRAYRVGSWEPGPRLGPGRPLDISPDSRLVVLGQMDGVYRLVELETGREIACLEGPEHVFAAAGFTPDGTRLVVAAENGLRVWDLRLLRKELVRLHLDWDAPAYPEAVEEKPEQLQIKVVGTERLAADRMPSSTGRAACPGPTRPARPGKTSLEKSLRRSHRQ